MLIAPDSEDDGGYIGEHRRIGEQDVGTRPLQAVFR